MLSLHSPETHADVTHCSGLKWMVRSRAQSGWSVDEGSVDKLVVNKRGGTSVASDLKDVKRNRPSKMLQ